LRRDGRRVARPLRRPLAYRPVHAPRLARRHGAVARRPRDPVGRRRGLRAHLGPVDRPAARGAGRPRPAPPRASRGHPRPARRAGGVRWASDGARVGRSAYDNTDRVWSRRTGTAEILLETVATSGKQGGSMGGALGAALSRDGRRLITASATELAWWDAGPGAL